MIPKRLLVLTLFAALAVMPACGLRAQPAIQWQKCYGGSQTDIFFYVIQTTDDGYLLAGQTSSDDSEVTGNHGSVDAWVVKTDAVGTIQWKNCLGGSQDDYLFSTYQTSDGGSISCGETGSSDGNVSGFHGGIGHDVWVVKQNSVGAMEWQKCLGGSNDDGGSSILQTADGGFILCGYTSSDDGDVSGNHGDWDAWVVKLNSTGTIQWQRCYGGSNGEHLLDMVQTTDGGFILAGYTYSNDGDVSGNHGGMDAWVVKIDPNGIIQWQKCLGGSSDDFAQSIIQTLDGGYIVAGRTTSFDGEVVGNHGRNDGWVVKMDSIGSIQWQRCLGGSGDDIANSIVQTSDSCYMVAGYTSSSDGDVFGKHGRSVVGLTSHDSINLGDTVGGGDQDAWVVKLDSRGLIIGQRCIGGNNTDDAWSVIKTDDGGYALAGQTESDDGDVSGNHGGTDAWVVKLCSFPSSQLCTRDVSTDTIGGTVYVPIIGYTDSIAEGLRFVLGYDTSLLVYRGSISHSGDTLNVPGAGWPGHAEILLDSAALSDDTLAGYAVFDVFPQSSVASTLVTFGSLVNNNPCASAQSVVASNVGLPHGCAVPILTNLMLYQKMPLFNITLANPNPLSQSTQITFTLPEVSEVTLTITDAAGRETPLLRSAWFPAGQHDITWDASNYPSGVYLCRLSSGGESVTERVVVLK